MQSKTTRGLRRLLVSTGVISLVLSVAAPAALATPPAGAGTPGAQMVKVCHNGRVLEMEEAALQAHLNHGDERVADDLEKGATCTLSDEPSDVIDGSDEHTYVRVCRDGKVDEITDEQVEALADHIDAGATALEELELGAACGTGIGDDTQKETVGETFVEVCHEGEVLEVEEHAVDGHLGHGDFLIVDGKTCPATVVDDGAVVDPVVGNPVIVEDTTPKVEVKPVEAENPGATPPAEKPAPVISTVTITRPAPATPAAPATPVAPAAPQAPAAPAAPAQPAVTAAPTAPVQPAPSVAVSATSRGNEVLGSVTTRTPGGTKVTALAATGTSTTVALAALGTVLLVAGLGLQLGARRRVRSSAVEV